MRIIVTMNNTAYNLYKKGGYPSHLLYGCIEIETAGNKVFYCGEGTYNVIKAYLKHKPDIIFMPFLNRSILFISLIKKIKISKIQIIAWSHHRIPKEGNKLLSMIFNKVIYPTINKLLFLSPLNMNEAISSGLVKQSQAIFIPWGADLPFYENFRNKKAGMGFISTGKENRDFISLINSFSSCSANLTIYSNHKHGSNNYLYLNNYLNKFKNIDIQVIENDSDSFVRLLTVTATSLCIVIPLIPSAINYCVGLSSIVEALVLGKPLIVTDNAYWPIDVEIEKIGIKVKGGDVNGWINAINFLDENRDVAIEMGLRARKLAEGKWNMENAGMYILNSFK